jgi:glycosyltransferase involved in cell wall biosynthesis
MLNNSKKKESKCCQFFFYLLGGIRPHISLPASIEDDQIENHLGILNERYKKLRMGFQDSEGNVSPLISIVIPVYIKESINKFLMAITSLLSNKNAPPLETIIVINGKVPENEIDKTDIYRMSNKIGLRIIKLSYSEDEIYRNIERPRNIFLARQAGVDEAQGSIIIAGDIDNIFSEHWINAYFEAFSKDPNLIAAYGPVGFYGTVGIIGRFMSWLSTFVKAAKILINYPPYAGHNHAIRKDIFNKLPSLYSEHIQVHENEIPVILKKKFNLKQNGWHIQCIQKARILTDFGKQKQSLSGAIKWFYEAMWRNIRQMKRLSKV